MFSSHRRPAGVIFLGERATCQGKNWRPSLGVRLLLDLLYAGVQYHNERRHPSRPKDCATGAWRESWRWPPGSGRQTAFHIAWKNDETTRNDSSVPHLRHPHRVGLFLVPDLWTAFLDARHQLLSPRIRRVAGDRVLDIGRDHGDHALRERAAARTGALGGGHALPGPSSTHHALHLRRHCPNRRRTTQRRRRVLHRACRSGGKSGLGGPVRDCCSPWWRPSPPPSP